MTLTAVTNAKAYDWSTWMIGLFRSFMSGGAVALATFGGASAVGLDSNRAWKMVGINFVAMGLYRIGEFLQLHGAPDQLQAQLNIASDSAKAAQVSAGQAVDAVESAKAIAPETTKKDE